MTRVVACLGVCVAMLGVILYGHIKMIEGMSPRPADWCDRFLPSSILSYFGDGRSTTGYEPVKTQEVEMEAEKDTTEQVQSKA